MRLAIKFGFLLLFGSVVRAEPGVSLETATDRSFYSEGARNDILVEARIGNLSPAPAGVRNIALVLDRSGSMAGERMDALRRAVATALGSIEPDEFISIVLFGSEVETLVPSKRRAEISDVPALVKRIDADGGAATYDGLNQAMAQVRRHAGPRTVDELIIVTDGPATKGPREFGDFVRLAEVFAGEGTMVSVIGIGDEIDEDMLAAIARAGHGHFRFADVPAKLGPALQAELALHPVLLGTDATLSFEFKSSCSHVRAYGWPIGVQAGTVATFRLPRLFAGEPAVFAVSAQFDPYYSGFSSYGIGTVRLRWHELDHGEVREIARPVTISFSADDYVVRRSLDRGVTRDIVNLRLRQGMGKAIDSIDGGDPRRAWRDLRSARNDALGMNAELDDPQVAESVRRFDAYLATLPPRGLNKLDRKILRSGLFGGFDPPTAEDTAEE